MALGVQPFRRRPSRPESRRWEMLVEPLPVELPHDLAEWLVQQNRKIPSVPRLVAEPVAAPLLVARTAAEPVVLVSVV